MKAILISVLALGLVACNPQPQQSAALPAGEWKVDGAQSRVSFASIKAEGNGEAHHFKTVSGGVAPDGTARIAIDLNSVDTKIDIRNERMREHLFEVKTYPEAVITAKLDPASFSNMAVGERRLTPVQLTIDLHGAKAPTDAEVYVTRVAADKVLVESAEPVIVAAEDFNLVPGLTKLKEIAKLPSITPVAPVSFSIVFTSGAA